MGIGIRILNNENLKGEHVCNFFTGNSEELCDDVPIKVVTPQEDYATLTQCELRSLNCVNRATKERVEFLKQGEDLWVDVLPFTGEFYAKRLTKVEFVVAKNILEMEKRPFSSKGCRYQILRKTPVDMEMVTSFYAKLVKMEVLMRKTYTLLMERCIRSCLQVNQYLFLFH